jgi:hypothetical protein
MGTLLASAALRLERTELTRIRRMRYSMILAARREELIETEVVIRQAAAMLVAQSPRYKTCFAISFTIGLTNNQSRF